MATSPIIEVPYELGFEVRYCSEALWSVGNDVFVGVELMAGVGGAFDEYASLITTLLMLAGTGALAGSQIPPHLSTIGDAIDSPISGALLVFQLRGARTDELTTVVCANLLSLGNRRFPLRRVLIDRDRRFGGVAGCLVYREGLIDPYPDVYSPLPFRLEFDPDQHIPSLTIEFASPLDASERQSAEDHLLTWAAACASGVYAAPMSQPDDCYLSFNPDDLVVDGNELTLTIAKLRCDPAVLRGLVNACAALHAMVSPIVSVTFQ